MLNLFIVDDEYYFRESLKVILPWEKLGIKICGEADNGAEALEKILQLIPDIILLDINMPFIDGLELTKAIKQKGLDSKIIIISGYSDFQYAKQAIQFGVSNYLLKPIDVDELKKSLESVQSIIESEKKSSSEMYHLAKQVKNHKHIMREQFLSELISGDKTSQYEEMMNKASSFSINISQKYFCVIAMEIESSKKLKWDKYEKTLWTFAVLNIATEVFSQLPYNCCFIHNDKICCIIGLSKEKDPVLNSKIMTFSDFIASFIKNNLNFIVTIGIGNVHSGIDGISRSYNESYMSLKNSFIIGNKKVVPFSKVAEADTIANYFPIEIRKRLLINMRINNVKEILLIIKEIFDNLGQSSIHPIIIYSHCIELISTCIEFATECNYDTQSLFQNIPDLVNSFYDKESLIDIQQLVIDTFLSTTEKIHNKKKNKSSKIVDDVKTYVNTNYHNSDLRIEQISKKLFLNYHYLCSIFKKETGITINNYITHVRMQKVKELIDMTNYTLTEISIKVGYDSPNYLSKCFKKHFGLSPNNYAVNKR